MEFHALLGNPAFSAKETLVQHIFQWHKQLHFKKVDPTLHRTDPTDPTKNCPPSTDGLRAYPSQNQITIAKEDFYNAMADTPNHLRELAGLPPITQETQFTSTPRALLPPSCNQASPAGDKTRRRNALHAHPSNPTYEVHEEDVALHPNLSFLGKPATITQATKQRTDSLGEPILNLKEFLNSQKDIYDASTASIELDPHQTSPQTDQNSMETSETDLPPPPPTQTKTPPLKILTPGTSNETPPKKLSSKATSVGNPPKKETLPASSPQEKTSPSLTQVNKARQALSSLPSQEEIDTRMLDEDDEDEGAASAIALEDHELLLEPDASDLAILQPSHSDIYGQISPDEARDRSAELAKDMDEIIKGMPEPVPATKQTTKTNSKIKPPPRPFACTDIRYRGLKVEKEDTPHEDDPFLLGLASTIQDADATNTNMEKDARGTTITARNPGDKMYLQDEQGLTQIEALHVQNTPEPHSYENLTEEEEIRRLGLLDSFSSIHSQDDLSGQTSHEQALLDAACSPRDPPIKTNSGSQIVQVATPNPSQSNPPRENTPPQAPTHHERTPPRESTPPQDPTHYDDELMWHHINNRSNNFLTLERFKRLPYDQKLCAFNKVDVLQQQTKKKRVYRVSYNTPNKPQPGKPKPKPKNSESAATAQGKNPNTGTKTPKTSAPSTSTSSTSSTSTTSVTPTNPKGGKRRKK